MAQSSSKQNLANLMHGYNQIAELARRLYNDPDLKDWAVQKSLDAQGNNSCCPVRRHQCKGRTYQPATKAFASVPCIKVPATLDNLNTLQG